jgi:hypothetical protein
MLVISGNRLSGTIPPSLGSLSNLEYLYVWANQFNGTIPSSLGCLNRLLVIDMYMNSLTGSVPATLGNLTDLVSLSLSQNKLGGFIPSTFGNMKNLMTLQLSVNSISGSIPSSLCELKRLNEIYADRNRLTGSLPERLGSLMSLTGIYLNDNMLTGLFPERIGCLISLTIVYLNNNMLSRVLPSSLVSLNRLQILIADNNRFSGRLPYGLLEMRSLEVINLAYNSISGPLAFSESFNASGPLGSVQIHYNYLFGSVPEALFQARRLRVLQLQSNALTGPVPISSAVVADCLLSTLDLSDNALTGEIPGALFLYPQLREVAIAANCFRGDLPETICSAYLIEAISMNGLSSGRKCDTAEFVTTELFSTGLMSGSIPGCVFSLPSLRTLSMAGNGFLGSLAPLGKASPLVSLSLSYNHIGGTIPASYLDPALPSLELVHNRMRGTLSQYRCRFNNTITPCNGVLKAAVNRLSGTLPSAVEQDLSNLDVVEGNLFSCTNKKPLPSNDPNSHDTVCGSDDLNASVISWSAVAGVVCCAFISVWYLFAIAGEQHSLKGIFRQKIEPFMAAAVEFKDLSAVIHLSKELVLTTVTLVVAILLVCIPGYVLLKNLEDGEYGTHKYQLTWLVTGVMLKGWVPAVILLLAWAVLAVYVTRRLQTHCLSGIMSSVEQNREAVEWLPPWSQVVGLLVVIMISSTLSFLINSSYYYFSIRRSSSQLIWVQFALSLCRFVIKKGTSMMLKLPIFDSMKIADTASVLSFVFFICEVILPCIAYMCAEPSCFADLLVPPDDISSVYGTSECSSYETSLQYGVFCLSEEIVYYSLTYSPRFVYNMQCGATVIKAFAPVLIISNSISAAYSLLVSLMAVFDIDVVRFIPLKAGSLVFPKLLLQRHLRQRSKLIHIPEVFAVLFQNVGIICSFGLIVPFVALTCGLSSFMIWLKLTLCFSYYYKQEFLFLSSDNTSSQIVSRILEPVESDCRGIRHFNVTNMWYVVIGVCGALFGGFLIDIAADNENISMESSIWIFSSTIAIIVILITWGKFMRRYLSQKDLNSALSQSSAFDSVRSPLGVAPISSETNAGAGSRDSVLLVPRETELYSRMSEVSSGAKSHVSI